MSPIASPSGAAANNARMHSWKRDPNRLGHWLLGQGVRPGQHVGLYMQNCMEYIEGTLAAYKVRAVPINMNFRYVAAELHHLVNDADMVGVVLQADYAERLAEVAPDAPVLRWSLVTGPQYEGALAASSSERDFSARSGDDLYVLYTGGTTGMPKGVVWRHEDAFFACMGGGDPSREEVSSVEELVERIAPSPSTFLALAPLMHAAGSWTVFVYLFSGNRAVLWPGPLDPAEVWRTIERERATATSAVGDAVLRPLLDAWDSIEPKPDISSLQTFSSGARRCRRRCGSGSCPPSPRYRWPTATGPRRPAFRPGASSLARAATNPSHDSKRPKPWSWTRTPAGRSRPDSGKVGRVARTGRIPLGYYNDPVKSAATFVEWDGRRWSLTGDMGTVVRTDHRRARSLGRSHQHRRREGLPGGGRGGAAPERRRL